jgi:hypothetical protein
MMKRITLFLVGCLIVALALYGAARLVSDSLGASSGAKVAKSADSFMVGAAKESGRNFWNALDATPDAELEAAAEAFSRKLYPLVKGFVKGQAAAMKEDKDKEELRRLWRDFGRDISENVLTPFVRGVTEGAASKTALEGAGTAVKGVREFGEQAGKIVEGLLRGLGNLQKGLPEINIEIPPPRREPSPGPEPPPR